VEDEVAKLKHEMEEQLDVRRRMNRSSNYTSE